MANSPRRAILGHLGHFTDRDRRPIVITRAFLLWNAFPVLFGKSRWTLAALDAKSVLADGMRFVANVAARPFTGRSTGGVHLASWTLYGCGEQNRSELARSAAWYHNGRLTAQFLRSPEDIDSFQVAAEFGKDGQVGTQAFAAIASAATTGIVQAALVGSIGDIVR